MKKYIVTLTVEERQALSDLIAAGKAAAQLEPIVNYEFPVQYHYETHPHLLPSSYLLSRGTGVRVPVGVLVAA
jgi:hypothetical protein